MLKRLVMLTMLLGLFAIPLVASPGSAAASPTTSATPAVERCQQLDAEGSLAVFGLTFGECVNIINRPSSEQANNFIAGICGIDEFTASFGGSKGQCIKIVRELF